jgi:hypothetical protein
MLRVALAKGQVDKWGYVHPQANGWCVLEDEIMVDTKTYHLQGDAFAAMESIEQNRKQSNKEQELRDMVEHLKNVLKRMSENAIGLTASGLMLVAQCELEAIEAKEEEK